MIRTLYLPIFEPGSYHERSLTNKDGLRKAFEKVGKCLEIDYLAIPRDRLFDELAKTIKQFKPTIIFSQLQGPDCLTPLQLRELHTMAHITRCSWVNWNGDYSPDSLYSPAMIDLLQWCDYQLVVNGSALDHYGHDMAQHGYVRAALWPFAYETPNRPLPEVPEYDVVYLGNNYSPFRATLYEVLRSLPYRVGIFGNGWPQSEGETTYDFTQGEAIYRNAKITISDNQYYDAIAYLSNRPFQAMAAGCMVLQQRVKEVTARVGFVDGVHWWTFKDLDEIPDLVRYFLGNETHRGLIAGQGQQFVQEHHNFDVRVQQLLQLLRDADLPYEDTLYDQ